MTLKQWTPVVLVIGASYILQPPPQEGPQGPGNAKNGSGPAAVATAQGPYRTVELDVTGMT